MNPLFLKPIGKLQELGTPRQWLGTAIGWTIFFAALITAYFYL